MQINLHHSRAASAALLLRLTQKGEEIVLVQEPLVVGNRICGLNLPGYRVYYEKGVGEPRACILIKSNYNAFIISSCSDKDTTTVMLEHHAQTLWMVSSYMAHDHQAPPPYYTLRRAVTEAGKQKATAIIGADANAHHTVWGSSDINERGESLLTYILSTNLLICGNEPTFANAIRREVLDITLVTEQSAHLNKRPLIY